ncbi:MAG: DUF2314 domain-containing protein [Verrucomicrobiales bacterium]|nr:DUF2314 domain-containing protein [Verrucomicrobiales bacterium]
MRPRIKDFPILSTGILIALIIRLVMSGLSWVGVTALVISMVWFGWEIVRWLQPLPDSKSGIARPAPSADKEKEEAEDELISLVYFLSEPREAHEDAIRNCVSNALDIEFDTSNPNADHFVMQFNPPETRRQEDNSILHFMVKLPEGLFAILVSGLPYIDQPEDFAKHSIRDKRLRNAVQQHQAWLSVDLMESPDQARVQDEAYAVIGKILSYLAGPDCLAIYCPQLQRCNEFDLALIETLASGHPLALFEEPTFEPIIEISDSNPKMAAAVKEAIDRWDEFVKEFESRRVEESDRYIVKVEFREGKKCEYMWVQVENIGPDEVVGILMNDPHELINVHRGATVTFTLDRLNDWIYPTEDGSHIGGFTLDVLANEEE